MQAAKNQDSKTEATKKADELFEAPPKGVKLMTQIDEIGDKIAALTKQREFLLSKEREAAVVTINAQIAKLGITVNDLDFGMPVRMGKSMAGTKVPIKYKLGMNVWSGRGRKPKWLEDHIAGGGKLEDALVK